MGKAVGAVGAGTGGHREKSRKEAGAREALVPDGGAAEAVGHGGEGRVVRRTVERLERREQQRRELLRRCRPTPLAAAVPAPYQRLPDGQRAPPRELGKMCCLSVTGSRRRAQHRQQQLQRPCRCCPPAVRRAAPDQPQRLRVQCREARLPCQRAATAPASGTALPASIAAARAWF